MADEGWKACDYSIIHVVSYRRGIVSVAIGWDGGEGTTRVAIDIIIIVVFRICFGFVIIVIYCELFVCIT